MVHAWLLYIQNSTQDGAFLSLGTFLLLPGVFLDHLEVQFPVLSSLISELRLRLDQFLTLDQGTAEDLWNEVQGKPLLREFLDLALTLCKNGTVLNTVTGGADIEWLIGGSDASCAGMSHSDRLRSTDRLCGGGLLNDANVTIVRNVSGGGIQIFGGISELDVTEEDQTVASDSVSSTTTTTTSSTSSTDTNSTPSRHKRKRERRQSKFVLGASRGAPAIVEDSTESTLSQNIILVHCSLLL